MNNQDIPKLEKRKSSKKAIVLLVMVFLLGAITGMGGSIMVMIHRLQNNLNNPELADGPANRVINRMENDLKSHLDLSPEESSAVREELEQSRKELREIRIKLSQDLRRVAGDTTDRIGNRLPEAKRQPLRDLANKRLKPWGLQPDQ